MADVKPLYLDSNGVYRPVAGTDTAVFPNLKLTQLTTADGVLSSDGSGVITSAKLVNANVSSSAAIAYSKLSLSNSVVDADIAYGAAIAYGKLNLSNGIQNGDINASAAIAYTKLNLGSSIVNADISNSAAIAYTKLNLSSSIVNADVASGAAIAYSKLNLGSSIVNNDVSASAAIAYSKLNLASSITSSDIAAASGIALYADASPNFTNKVQVGSVTSSDTAYAATVQFVLDQVSAATSGLDYKQEAKWYWNLNNNTPALSQPDTVAGFLAGINGYGVSVFTAGERILMNAETTANNDVGIWVFGGSTGAYTLTRASDAGTSIKATGAWVYCLKQLGEGGAAVAFEKAYVCNTTNNFGGANQFILYSSGTSFVAGSAIDISGSTISVKVGAGLTVPGSGGSAGYLIVNTDGSTIEVNGSNQVALKSLPSQFKINGVTTSSNVTASNLDTLTGAGDAAGLHRHGYTLSSHPNGASLSAGAAVYFDGSDLVAGTKGVGKAIGVIVSSAGGNALVATSGECTIFSPAGSPSVGDNLYLGASGGLCDYASLSSGDYVTKVGKYLGSDKVAIAIQEFGVKP